MKLTLWDYIRASFVFVRAFRKYGLDGVEQRVQEIKRQSDFWDSELTRIYKAALVSIAAGDKEMYSRHYAEYQNAMSRLKRDVELPLKNLGK